ncbi:S8 family serine peptidase [Streptomyces sp. JJ66]|uniref:S8 family serine peptidase n=1 Tax=Streptomyces sp. JJ66 TaxID=2803843 RepID=UPI0027E313D0|nr:S8 family serine peptidase [Streptomyces sp. JJ66]
MTTAALIGTGITTSAAAPGAPGIPVAPAADTAEAIPAERLIVGYRSQASEAKSDDAAAKDATEKAKASGEKLDFERRLGTGAALVDLGGELEKADVEDVMAEFATDPDVAYVVPDTRMYATAAKPNDDYYERQWDLFEDKAGMKVPGAWDHATGKGVTIAVIDTGYVAHSDLADNIIDGYDFISDTFMAADGDGRDSDATDPGDWLKRGECGKDPNTGDPIPEQDTDSSWHGTHVAGTAAAATHNGKGIAGIAYAAKVQPVRVLGKCGGTTSDIIDAITWASGGSVKGVPKNEHPADVLNLSLGGNHSCDSASQSAINGAVKRGATVVVAAGNSNANAANHSPANCDSVITVAASDREGNRARYSNYGKAVEITAPGGEVHVSRANGIWSTLNSGSRSADSESYAAYQGTSMAAPHIAGLAALLYQAKPSITPGQVSAAIRENARDLPGSCSGGCGAGLADAAATLKAVTGGSGSDPEPDPPADVYTNSDDVAIPDDNTWVTSKISVTGRSGAAPADLKVGVDIKHPYRGDLVLEIVAPGGESARLKSADANDSGANLVATYTVDASSATANGTWTLRVADAHSDDTGYLDSWSLTF